VIKPFQVVMLNDFLETHQEIEKEKSIEYRKATSKLQGKSRKDSKPLCCYYCKEEVTTFCNSHSIPAFVLRNIASNGSVYSSNKFAGIPLMENDKGINNSGTFQIICRKCDSSIFSDYEDPGNYKSRPTNKMIAQIALKNQLKLISKRRFEIALYENMKNLPMYGKMDDFPQFNENGMDKRQEINNLDLAEGDEEFTKAKKAINQKWSNEYYTFFYQKLDYVVPIATQTIITLPIDFDGHIINDIYNYSPAYKMQSIHVCIFPFQAESIVLMFIDAKHTRLKSFYRKFSKLTLDDQLSTINFMLFAYSEDYFISRNIDEKLLENQKLIAVSQYTNEIVSLFNDFTLNDVLGDILTLSHRNEIPNLLSKECSIG